MRRSGRPGLSPLAGPFLLPVTPLHRGSEGGDGGRHGGCDCVITKATTDIMRIVASITTVVVGAIRIAAQTLSDLSDSSEQVGVALRLTRHRDYTTPHPTPDSPTPLPGSPMGISVCTGNGGLRPWHQATTAGKISSADTSPRFDGMLRRKRSKNGAAAAPVEDEIDRLSALPDDALRQVLDLLPANEVVRTSVLAQRWRHLWKSTTVLRVRSEDERSGHVKELRVFVDHLLLLRSGAPLERYELWFFGFDDEDVPRVNLWFRHVVMCKNCDDSDDIGDGSNNCVLLQGFIFKRDMRRCPTFSNLKTLLLNEYWCVPDHFCSLACILQHSPVLKKLTLQLFSKGPQHKVEMKGITNHLDSSAAMSKHLESIEIKCEVVDERVIKILKFMYALCM
ncbi:hypothetical protein PR202_gb12652 [Eleusine coracana subsp. coracana]|uniref:F-box domain-containing protein n=1 Tax=Eleusine coracana subsp. coracana TaxID=191504 RepID=A0AAV5EQK1_ELECO|nr:hypothetical protein PR202_gb12652 [Eleusine coracana subsp. coracana]